MRSFTPDEALALSIHLDLSKHAYQDLLNEMKARHCADIFPAYNKVFDAANRCCPDDSAIRVTASGVKIKLQGLLDLTVSRLLQVHENVLLEGLSADAVQLVLESKWGFDGSSGHARYKQKTDGEFTDGSVFMTCLVPLRLLEESTIPDNNPEVVWLNPAPSSTRFCRLIQFEFEKETEQLTTSHFQDIQSEIDVLQPTETQIGNVKVTTEHRLYPCMVDGKICSALASTSTQRCHVCGACPTEMNNFKKLVAKQVAKETYKFGLSPLHFRIRCLEAVLSIAYRIDFKKWRANNPAHKALLEARKKSIQDKFKQETGLLIDFVKQGYGTTNDGNTARRFFRNPEQASEITGVDVNLISRLGVISEVLSCGRAIDINAFKSYCLETYELYVTLYDWYYMPQSLHKVLFHGADIMQNFPLPVGFLTEEAQESRNKDLRNSREDHSRKISREATNRDVARRFMVTSDPLISSYRHPSSHAIEPTEAMKKLLV